MIVFTLNEYRQLGLGRTLLNGGLGAVDVQNVIAGRDDGNGVNLKGIVTKQKWYSPPEYDYDPEIAGAYRGPHSNPYLCTSKGAFVVVRKMAITRADLEDAGWEFWFHVERNREEFNPTHDYDIYHCDIPDDTGVLAIQVRNPDKKYHNHLWLEKFGPLLYCLPWPSDGRVQIDYSPYSNGCDR
jgi:hypothetical protein